MNMRINRSRSRSNQNQSELSESMDKEFTSKNSVEILNGLKNARYSSIDQIIPHKSKRKETIVFEDRESLPRVCLINQ